MTITSRLMIAATVCSLALLNSCSKKSSGPAGGGTGNGTFSVAIDGKTVSGSASIDNAVVIITANPTASFDSAGDIFVYLQIPGDSIGFHIPDRKGYTILRGGNLCDHLRSGYRSPKCVCIRFGLGEYQQSYLVARERHFRG